MKNTKGFTLIELLAVIVILAIIAVITVPKVAEMIESSRKGAAEDAFYGSIKSAELAWAKELQNNSSLSTVNCVFSSGAPTCTTSDSKTINYSSSGKNSSEGTIAISGDGSASVTAANSLKFNGYYCCGNSNKAYCNKTKPANKEATNNICE